MNIKIAQKSLKATFVLLLSALCLLAMSITALAQTTERPNIEIIKTASPATASPGDLVTYTYTIVNTGDVTLTDIVAVDDVLGTIVVSPTTLATGSAGSGTVTLPDGSTITYPSFITTTLTMVLGEDTSMLYNTATVTGTSPTGTMVTDSDTFELGYPGSIGNRIWSIIKGQIEPLEGVVVILTASDGTTQTATTDADGYYLFTGLAFDVYTVEVDTSTLPVEKQGRPPEISSDNGDDSMTTVILTESRPSSVIEDFAYAKPTAVALSQTNVASSAMPLLIIALVAVTAGATVTARHES